MMKLGDQQEILMGIADIIMDTYAMETAILRARKLARRRARTPRTLSRHDARVL